MRAFLVALPFVLVACGGDDGDPSRACVPGASVACTCVGGASGAQVCATDGASLGPCDCAAPADVDAVDDLSSDAPSADVPAMDAPGPDTAPDALPNDLPPGDALADTAEDAPGEAETIDDADTGGPCVPECAGKACGDDGCGGSCGSCDDGDATTIDTCDAFFHACQHVGAGDCDVLAMIAVQEGEEVCPQTVLHLSGEGSVTSVGTIAKYQWEVVQPSGSTAKFVPTPSYPSPTFEANVAGQYTFRLTVWNDANQPSCNVAEAVVYAVPCEAVHVELLWSTPGDPNPDDEGPMVGSDLDLHFAHPNASQQDLDGDGQQDPWFDPTWDTFWFYPLQNWGGIASTDDNPSLDRDDVDGNGPENVNLDVPEDGATYHVGVNYWDDHGFGTSFATVRVYVYAMLVAEWNNVTLVDHDLWWVGDIAWPSGQVTSKLPANGGYWLTHEYHHPLFYQP